MVARSDARPPGMGIPSLRPAHILGRRLVMKNFYDHYLPSADSRRAVVRYWRNECALTILVNCLGGLLGNSVDRSTDRARNDLKSVKES